MKTKGKTVLRFILIFGLIAMVLTTATVAAIGYYLHYQLDTSIDSLSLFTQKGESPSKLFTVENGELIEYASGEISIGRDNDYIPYEKIPKHLINSFVAIEDKRFFTHIGFDPITTAKAVFKYLFSQGSSPGGSTITQQLIKNLTGNDQVTIKRKLTEIMQAVKLEKIMSKEEILELYLNSIYLSQGTYGISAAAKLYFNKSVQDLTLVEAASIAAITQAPSKWDPILHPENNSVRRKIILDEMYALEMISQEEWSTARNSELKLSPCYDKVVSTTSSWYTDAVINEAISLLEEKLSVSRKVAEHHLYYGGYRIEITVNHDLQRYLEDIYRQDDLFDDPHVQSSFVITDLNGRILALIGGVGDKSASRVLNRATQSLRSPGSSIKPISLFMPTIEKKIASYATSFDDIPLYFGGEYPISGWPKNANGIYSGLVSFEKAVASSLNTAAVTLLQQVGITNTYRFLKDYGFFDSLSENDMTASALALGGMHNGVTLAEITAAYSIFPNGGLYTPSTTIDRIYDSAGQLVVDNRRSPITVCSEETAEIVTKLLQNVILRSDGTAYGAVKNLLSVSEVAGKTGTTSNNLDRWFIGYTPLCVGGIWLGYDEPSPLTDIHSKAHIKLWDTIMTEAHRCLSENSEKTAFRDDLLIETKYCAYSGKIPTDACYHDPRGNAVSIGYFAKDQLPKEPCSCHFSVTYCQEGHGIATENCPQDGLITIGLLDIQRSFHYPVWVRDYQYTGYRNLPLNPPYLGENYVYYEYMLPQGSYFGQNQSLKPYNRLCALTHFPPDFEEILPPDLEENQTNNEKKPPET